ncbi:MAG: ATP-binding protein [Myxococcales bacterium]
MANSTKCPECGGARYLIERRGELRVARACRCNDTCARCGGTGRIHVEKDGYSFVQVCSCRAIAQRLAHFNQAGLPARCGLSFDEFLPQNHAQEEARAVAYTTAMRYRPEEPTKGFVVAGPVGTGKTHLLCATLGYLTLELGVSARYVEVSFLFSEIRKGFSENRSGLDAIQPLVDADVLAIDELGKGRQSPFELDTLDELIARRYNTNRTTLFATNFSLQPEDPRAKGYHDPAAKLASNLLRDRVGERIYSRLHEMCHLLQFPPETPDFRKKDRGTR